MTTEDERQVYNRGRAAMRHLTKDKNFQWWVDYGQAIVSARAEAMRMAGTNQPVGKGYNLYHALVMKRERLIDEKRTPPFPDANTRKDAVALVDNLNHPVDARRLKGVLAWRATLESNDRARVNHPTAIMRRWKAETEPQVDKQARKTLRAMQPVKENPHLQALADAEGERDDARHQAETLRGLLGRILQEVDDLPPDLRTAIVDVLGSEGTR
jgi:hypothetical protein